MLIFCIWLGFDRNSKFIQFFWVTYSNSHPRRVGSKNLVEGTLMGGDLVIFWLTWEVPPQPIHYGKHCPPQNFLSKSESLIHLQRISPERNYHLNSFFCLAVQDYDWNLQSKFGYWWLLQFFSVVCSLNLSLCFYKFSIMFWHLGLMNLLFTYIYIYTIYIYYIYVYI